MLHPQSVIFRQLGLIDYATCLQMMQLSIAGCGPQAQHEVWMVEHPSVFTQGQTGKPEHLLDQRGIPCIQSDRGGQITYHGPGQLICYFLLDLARLELNVKQLVNKTTESAIDLLKIFNINGIEDDKNPGVYIEKRKIASLGFRVRKHMSYHGIAINNAMDLRPFSLINPCGRQQNVTQICDLHSNKLTQRELIDLYQQQLIKTFGFDGVIVTQCWPKHQFESPQN